MPSSTPTTDDDLRHGLEELGLRAMVANLDQILSRAMRDELGPRQVLEELVTLELRERNERGLERRLKRSRIGSFKPMADFDWNWPSHIDRERIERALALRFLDDKSNVLLVGAHGLGKTMILKNIAHRAVLGGATVLFTPASRLLTDLSSRETSRALERRIKYYARMAVLAIDELGYLSYDTRAADLLFEVVSRRHAARKPILLTTNLAFSEWPTVFPNATCTVALVDRLTHFADIIKIEGKSWRRKESLERHEMLDE